MKNQMQIRLLRAEEIDCRAQTVREDGCSVLLYKDARCDMNILDEVFGAGNWQRKHYECKGNLFCSVGLKVDGEWIWKDDCGSESYTEKEKGEASDSFKRACFNWGIGRELYTAPFIWVTLDPKDVTSKDNRYYLKTQFSVKSISYDQNRRITKLQLVDGKGKTRYLYDSDTTKKNISETSIQGAQTQEKICAWLAKQEAQLGAEFSIPDLISEHYKATDEVITQIVKIYNEFKQIS